MSIAALPTSERDRLRALWACDVLDTDAEEAFDDITRLAAKICDVPIALISLVDSERQWFKSRIGFEAAEGKRDYSFCAHAILSRNTLVIPDATQDVRTNHNPVVTGEPFIRFYAGAPLLTNAGFALGTLCVVDTKPRNLSNEQLNSLNQLARQVVSLLELRREQRVNLRMSKAMSAGKNGIVVVAGAVFLLGLTLTAILGQWNRNTSEAAAQERFNQVNGRVVREVVRLANQPFYGLLGARGVYAASKSVERGEFTEYVASRNLKREFPGVTSMGMLARVPRERVADFLAFERADDAPGFNVQMDSASTGDADHYIAKFVEPLAPNRASWGYDFGSVSGIRSAAEFAARSGESVITTQVQLNPANSAEKGYFAIVPVYRNRSFPKTEQQRLEALTGLLYASVKLEDQMPEVFKVVDEFADFKIFAKAAGQHQLLFSSRDHRDLHDRSQGAAVVQSRFALTNDVIIGNTAWVIETASTPQFENRVASHGGTVIGASGLVLSGLLAFAIYSIGRSRARAVSLANSMTADLLEAKNRAEKTSSELHAQSVEMLATSDMLRRTGAIARVGGWDLDMEKNKLTWTPEVYAIHEVPLGEHVSLDRAISFYSPDAQPVIRSAVESAMKTGQPWDVELQLITAKGNPIWVRAQGECIKSNGKTVRLCGAFQDVTDRRNAEEQLRITATHDKLTGLPNRSLLNDRLQQKFSASRETSDGGFAVLFLDFDRFKQINDTLGHDAGDELLKQISGRLVRCLRPGDAVGSHRDFTTVGRLGGDEFVVLVDRINRTEDVAAVANRVLEALSSPYRLDGNEIVSTASIGVVLSNAEYTRADEMLRDADIAMYEAKLAGKGRFVLFDKGMRERVARRAEIESDLRTAIAQQQMFVVYQPIVCLETGKIRGAEVLLRWNHPTRGMISPGDFIPIAEESGLIVPIGEWVLRTACRQFVDWQASLGELAPPTISVNLSRKQLMLHDLPELVKSILKETGMPPQMLHLEVTESTVMKDPKSANRILTAIREFGPRINLDDFGTGHSSLASLHQYPVDVLKIDRSFIANVSRGREFAALVQAIAQLARNLQMEVVAEGVETSEQVALLQTMECSAAQGFHFSKPLIASEMGIYLLAGSKFPMEQPSPPTSQVAA